MRNRHEELLYAAQHAVAVSRQLMSEMNRECGHEVAPGPVWKEALEGLEAAIAALSHPHPERWTINPAADPQWIR